MLLVDEGLSVTVLEANSRVGGRAYTARHIYGEPELGANQIGPYYARVRDMAERLGVELAPGANINAPFTYSIGGILNWRYTYSQRRIGSSRFKQNERRRARCNAFRHAGLLLEPAQPFRRSRRLA